MKLKCNVCGNEMGLDAVIDDDQAAQALKLALEMTPLGKLLIKYIALFRPKSKRLSWAKVGKILGELLPMITAERIERDRQVYDAPNHVWCSAIEAVLSMRDLGRLTLPMASHGYLFEIIATQSKRSEARGLLVADDGAAGAPATSTKPQSATAKAINALESRKRGE